MLLFSVLLSAKNTFILISSVKTEVCSIYSENTELTVGREQVSSISLKNKFMFLNLKINVFTKKPDQVNFICKETEVTQT